MSRQRAVSVSAQDLAARVGATVLGDPERCIKRLASLEVATVEDLSFLADARYLRAARSTQAGAVLVTSALAEQLPAQTTRLIVENPYLAYARLSQWFQAPGRFEASEGDLIHPSASVHPEARIAEGVRIGAGVCVEAGAQIAAGCRIAPGCFIGEGAVLGEASVLHANVVIYDGVRIGARALIHSGTVIGADGFGFAPSPEGYVKIAQLGSVCIGDDVEIGANCAIDRGALADTQIGDGVKIDNLVQVAHNVRIGAHTVIAGCVGIAGSATIGARCMIGGGVGIAGHIEICDGAVIGGFSLVERTVDAPGFYTGAWPLQAHAHWERTAATLKQLPQLRQRLRGLESRRADQQDPKE